MDHQMLVSIALDAGAGKAAVLHARDICLNADFRRICQSNACGMYDSCWMCPPEVGSIEACMDQVKQYEYGLLYQSVSDIDDSFDIEGMTAAGQQHAWLSQRIEAFMMPVLGKHLHLTCGACRLCDTCAKRSGLPCRKPEQALSSMEAFGIDVYNTCKSTDLKYINGQNTVTYFGIVLFKEASCLF